MRSPRLRMRPLVAALVGLGIASPVAAQFEQEVRFSVEGGAAFGSAFDLFSGGISLTEAPRTGQPALAIRSAYRERVEQPLEIWAGARMRITPRYSLGSRLRRGYGDALASVSGGVGGQEGAAGAISWYGLDLSAGVETALSTGLRGRAYAGPSIVRWDVDAPGRQSAVAHVGELDEEAEPLSIGLPWQRAEVSTWGAVAGLDLAYSISPSLSLVASAEARLLSVQTPRLAERHSELLRGTAGRNLTVRFDRHRTGSASAIIGVRWEFARHTRRDPGPEAIARVTAQSSASGTGALRDNYGLPTRIHELLAAGDSVGAIAALEQALEGSPEQPALLGTLGILLAEKASTRESEFRQRARAQRLLDEALRHDPGNPRYLYALGLLLEKRGTPRDARIVLGRTLEAAIRRPHDLAPGHLAAVFFRRGQTLEREVQEFEGLRLMGTEIPLVSPQCATEGAFCLNWSSPREFYEVFASRADLSSVVAEKRVAMLEEYRRALRLDPAHSRAARALLAAHARAGAWEAFDSVARLYAIAEPLDPWAGVFLGVALHASGDMAAADSLFSAALPALDPADHAVFRDIRPLLRRGRDANQWVGTPPAQQDPLRADFFRRADPLYLTPENESELEHTARVALAELLFGEPQSGTRGWATDRGQILIRYGWPTTIWQVRRDAALVEVWGGADRNTEERGGGRWIFWNYDPGLPSFIFEKNLGRLSVRHMAESASRVAASDLEVTAPSVFLKPFRDAGEVTHQLARFQGLDRSRPEVEIFASAPLAALGGSPPDSVIAGVFLFQAPGHTAAAEVRPPVRDDGFFSIRAQVPPGIYRFSIEAASLDRSAASVSRGDMIVGAYSPSPLRISDLLLAKYVLPQAESPRSRRDLDYEGLSCMSVPADRRSSVVFEIYGLETESGLARYTVEIRAGETDTAGLTVKLLRGVRNLFGRPGESQLGYERVIESDDGRTVEWFDLDLPGDLPDPLQLGVTVTDRIAERAVRTERLLASGRCDP